jgi:hypothetical protein
MMRWELDFCIRNALKLTYAHPQFLKLFWGYTSYTLNRSGGGERRVKKEGRYGEKNGKGREGGEGRRENWRGEEGREERGGERGRNRECVAPLFKTWIASALTNITDR